MWKPAGDRWATKDERLLPAIQIQRAAAYNTAKYPLAGAAVGAALAGGPVGLAVGVWSGVAAAVGGAVAGLLLSR
jgi:hypothetical protein